MTKRGSWTRRPLPAHAIAQRQQRGRMLAGRQRKRDLPLLPVPDQVRKRSQSEPEPAADEGQEAT